MNRIKWLVTVTKAINISLMEDLAFLTYENLCSYVKKARSSMREIFIALVKI
jgi:hypothetical protein